jgi:flagellar M-ring protein FliF
MASVPTTTASGSENTFDGQGKNIAIKTSGNGDMLAGFGGLDILRQLGLMVGLMASVAIGFAVVLWSRSDNYQPVFGNMQGYDASMIMDTLDANTADYRIDPNSGVILVRADDLASIRLRLAAAGVTRYDGTGYELLDEEQSLGTSQFMEANRVKRSQEGELQRTIMSFRNVQSARVHIAIPERSVFMRSTNKPTASVFLSLNSGGGLSEVQIEAMANLVASSIPELSVDDVTIVDQRGNLLSKKETNFGLEMADQQFQYARKFEASLVDRVRGILSPIVGFDGFQAEVTADIDFTQLEQAAESYDPSTQVLRSEQTLDERLAGGEATGGIPGALANQPPANGVLTDDLNIGNQTAEALSGNRRQTATRNYELGRQVSYTNHDPVAINRISVAVVLDDLRGAGDAPAEPWSEAQLTQITTLVKDAVGFSEIRGDSVTVINSSFAKILSVTPASIPVWEQSWLQNLAKQLAAGIFILLLVMGVLRPVLKNLANVNPESRQLALAATQGDFSDFASADQAMMNDDVQFSSGGGDSLPNPGSGNGGYDRQINTVRGLIAEDPGRVAQVVKKWVGSDGEQ